MTKLAVQCRSDQNLIEQVRDDVAVIASLVEKHYSDPPRRPQGTRAQIRSWK
jgi:hypothetical protein